jgi:hypothetical protein
MTRRSLLPQARPEGLVVEQVGDETVVYDVHTRAAHCLKPLAALVFAAGDGATTVEDAAGRAGVEPEAVIDAVGQLERLGLLDVPLVVVEDDGPGVSRRDMLRNAGYAGAAAAAAAPLITSIAAPTPAGAAAGTLPSGCSGCTTPSDCTSGICCQAVNFGGADHICNSGCCVPKLSACWFCGCVIDHDSTRHCDCAVLASDLTPASCPTCPSGHPSCCRTTSVGCVPITSP